jgi:hypothetical protein
MILLPRQAVAFALVLGLSACSGTPAVTQPTEFEEVPTDIPAVTPPATTPDVVNPTPPDATGRGLDAGWGRPAEITLVLAGTNDSDGTYTSSGPATNCGNTQFNLTYNTRAFSFDFGDLDQEIEGVEFSADDLVPGSTTASLYLYADVKTKLRIGLPPAIVVSAKEPGSGDTGTATLSESDGIRTLIAQGTNAHGDSINLTAICGPV